MIRRDASLQSPGAQKRTPVLAGQNRVDSRGAPGSPHRSRCARTQPQGHHGRDAARPAGRDHRSLGQRQVEPRFRHHLRRRPAALRGIAVCLRPPVPRTDGEAGCRQHRRPLTGHLHRPEGRQSQPPVHGRHGHGDLRPSAPALRASRPPALPGLRPGDHAHDRAADRRPHPHPAGGQPHPRAGPPHPRPQDRRGARLLGRASAGLRSRARGRRAHGPGRRPGAGQVQAPQHRCRRGPPHHSPC
ncbi:hypothetical protein BH23CHL8_BH23CHL8_13130 [soil metagenome]